MEKSQSEEKVPIKDTVCSFLEKSAPVQTRNKNIEDTRKLPTKVVVCSSRKKSVSVRSRSKITEKKIDHSQILNKSIDDIRIKSVEEEPLDTADDQNNAVDDKREDVKVESNSISMLEEEVRGLRSELDAKEEFIERQKIEKKKMEKKYYEMQERLKKIGIIVTSYNHEEQQ